MAKESSSNGLEKRPKLRFPGFDEPWKVVALGNILQERNEYSEKDGSYEHATLSKEGIYGKTARYDRDFLVSTENKKYKVTHYNDLCYNPANLKFGVICLNKYGDAIFSPIYITFEIDEEVDVDFLGANLTRWDFINRALRFQQGTVYERMAVSPEDFLSIQCYLPSKAEQICISSFVQSLNKRIDKQEKLVEALKKYKRGAIDGLLSRKLHFQTTSSWREVKISELFSPISEKGYVNLTVLTIVQGVGTQPRESVERRISYDKSNTNTYKRVLENDFILHLRSFEGGLEIANSEGIVSPAYTILRTKEQIIPLFYYVYFRSYWFISNKLRIAVEGIRDGKSINMETFWNIVVPYPPIEEQKHIAEYLLCLDTKLKKAEAILDRLKAIKKGFSQQLFI